MKLSFYLHKYHNYDRDRIQVKTRRVTKKLVTLLSFAYLKDSFIYLNKKYYIIFKMQSYYKKVKCGRIW